MGPIPKSELYAEISECEQVVRPTEATVWRIGGDFSFANYEDILHRLKKLISRLPQRMEYKVLEPEHSSNISWIDLTKLFSVRMWSS